jgi:hypothetical protein
MSDKKKNYPNRWRVLVNAPDEYFYPMPFEDVIESNWSLRPGTAAIIRAEHMQTGKVKEFAYKREASCAKRIEQLMDTHVMTIMTEDVIGCINYDPNND